MTFKNFFEGAMGGFYTKKSEVLLMRVTTAQDPASSKPSAFYENRKDFVGPWLKGNYEEVIDILWKHVGYIVYDKNLENGKIIAGAGLRSYTINPETLDPKYIADLHKKGQVLQTTFMPAGNIFSSKYRLQKYLQSTTRQQREQALHAGVGFNINRLFEGLPASVKDATENEICVFKY